MKNWNNFIKEFSDYILPIYQNNENVFDDDGIHGRLHISRSILFSEFMARFSFQELRKDIDFSAIRYAVSFHDAGRQGNGIDLWENDSSKLCYSYLTKKEKYPKLYCIYVSSLIKKGDNSYVSSLIKKGDNSNIKDIVHDSDVLEIMRPCCGHGGIEGFNSDYFKFLRFNDKYNEIRNYLIDDAWKLIEYTEENKQIFNNNNHLYKIIDIVKKNSLRFRVLKI